VLTVEARPADPFLDELVELDAEEVLVPVPVPVPVPLDELPEGPAAPLLVGPELPEPLSATEVLRQLESLLASMVTIEEYTVLPELSLRATLKLVLAWRSTSQVYVSPVCCGKVLIGDAET